jgi:diguanylate cyclase (GGDEF)-like protein
MMEGVSGLEVLEWIRADPHLRNTPVIVLTSARDPETKLKVLSLGATDFLSKPVDASELVLRLRNTLAFKSYHERLVHVDGLTGLLNRFTFIDRVGWALENGQRHGTQCALLHLDAARIKSVNDSLGYQVGDSVVRIIAERIAHCLRSATRENLTGTDDSVLARIGGDDFAILLTNASKAGSAEAVAERLLEALSSPICVDRHEVNTVPRVGIALFPEHGSNPDTLLKHAEAALNQAKQRGKNSVVLFSRDRSIYSRAQISMESDLHRALERGELQMHYQPKISLATGNVVGAEAIMRWAHPIHGFVPPAQFIPMAEQIGLITEMGAWALEQACRHSEVWRRAGVGAMSVSVNVSGAQFRRGDLINAVRNALQKSGIDPSRLILEITESVLMQNTTESLRAMLALQDLGVGLSMDDFGTGFSSLSYLKRFPLDELKIDRSFIKDIPGDSESETIVSTLITLAHNLSLKVIAEGVELDAQRQFLKARGCDEYQGFLFSQPIPAAQFGVLLRRSALPSAEIRKIGAAEAPPDKAAEHSAG